jgi:hypothetical protein
MDHLQIMNVQRFLMPLFFIGIGLAVLVRKQPVILNYRWFALFIVSMLVLPAIENFSFSSDLKTFLPHLLFVLLIGFMFYMLKGMMVLAADGDDFQKKFIEVLTEENYEFEQTFTSIKIKEPALEISVAFQSWLGNGQIRMRSKENKETFDKIISQLKTKSIKTNLIIPLFYMLFGVVILLMNLFI